MQHIGARLHKQDVTTSSSTASDAEILRRSRLDAAAFGELFDRHAVPVHRFLARRIDPRLADDLLSEVFLHALEARVRVRPHESGSALPWLYGIARNVIRGHLRSRDRPAAGTEEEHVDWDAVDERLDAGTLAPDLRAALSTLTGIEREVLLLVSWEQLSITEAAAALGISKTAARSRLHRARARAAAALVASPNAPHHQETP
jgi:RNA polymerase sigma-70 factor (ECF subfamily)